MTDLECALENLKASEEKYDTLKKDYDRKTYLASGLAGLIVQTGDKDLVHKASKIADDADKLF